jgi:hypothetical protein
VSTASPDADRLVYRASRWKAALMLAFGGASVWHLAQLRSFAAAARTHPAEIAGSVLIAVAGLAVGGTGMFGARTLTFDREGVTVSSWGRSRTLRWPMVRRVSVFWMRGAAMLQIDAIEGRGILTSGWTADAYEIVDEVEALRARSAGKAPPESVDPRRFRERNRLRRMGMGLALASVALAFASFGDIAEMAPEERPPGMDFQWAVAPTPLQLSLMVVAMALALIGLWRWFWPVGKPARPPLATTLPEVMVLGITFLAHFGSALILLDWASHRSS